MPAAEAWFWKHRGGGRPGAGRDLSVGKRVEHGAVAAMSYLEEGGEAGQEQCGQDRQSGEKLHYREKKARKG